MCKKDKRYRIILQVAVWNSDHTKVYKYERQTLLVKAKNPQRALEKAGTSHAVLMVKLDK